MQSITTILAASAMLTVVCGSPTFPLLTRSVCGSAPSGSSGQTILLQPDGVDNAAACQADCEANSSCQSFVFGMVNNANECMLFSCAASAIPKQSSTNLVAYDKDCQSVPTATPTASNPTGAKSGSTGNTGPNSNPNGGNPPNLRLAARNPPQPNPPQPNPPQPNPPQPNPPQPNPPSPKLAARNPPQPNPPQPNPPKPNPPSPKLAVRNPPQPNPPKPNPPKPNPPKPNPSKPNTPKLAARDTCGDKPNGQTNVAPLSTPANIGSASDCQAQCKANPSCQSFEFGTLTAGGSKACRLFAIPASSVPAPSAGQTFAVYNVGCSM